tara:strand:+ start:192 stop:893 length:702 start_codon:yes stop_codon:yes gene_type:complete
MTAQNIKNVMHSAALNNLSERAGINQQHINDAVKLVQASKEEDEIAKSANIPVRPEQNLGAPPSAQNTGIQQAAAEPEKLRKIGEVREALSTNSSLDKLALMKMMQNQDQGQGQPQGQGQGPEGLVRQAKEGGRIGEEFSGRVPGRGHGMEDNVHMPVIEGGEKVANLFVSPDEYVIDAASVAALGNGSSEEGAHTLDRVVKDIRKEAYGTTKQPNEINGLASLTKSIKSNIG